MPRKKTVKRKKRTTKSRSKTKYALAFGTKSKPKLGKSRFSSKKALNKKALELFS